MTPLKPICLEVCSGEGGSTRGLMNAGWDVIAVDNSRARLKRNPARWRVLGDAFDAIAALGADVDLIWAGWPCQDYSAGTRAARAHGIATGHKRLIAAGREAMAATGTPWVMRPPDTDVVSHWLITTQGQLWSHYQYVQKGRPERPAEIEYRRITHGRVEWETVAVVRSQVLKWLGRQG